MKDSNRNHDSFIAHYQDNKDKLLTYLMYRLNFDSDLAEDLLMDIVLRAYENFDKFDPEKGSFKSWIFTIARNYLVNHWRSNKRRKIVSLDTAKQQSAVEINEEKQKIERIFSLMKECMSKSDVELLTLRYIHDFSNKEIAQMLGKSDGAVRTSLSRALDYFGSVYEKIYPNSQ